MPDTPSTEELIARLAAHIRMMAPHQREREAGKLIVGAKFALEAQAAELEQYKTAFAEQGRAQAIDLALLKELHEAELARLRAEPAIAIVTTSHDYGATIDWRLNPLPTGTELYERPPPPAQPAPPSADARDAARWRRKLFELGVMEDAPCFFCGYNGPGYFQPTQHACAIEHHAAIDAAAGKENN